MTHSNPSRAWPLHTCFVTLLGLGLVACTVQTDEDPSGFDSTMEVVDPNGIGEEPGRSFGTGGDDSLAASGGASASGGSGAGGSDPSSASGGSPSGGATHPGPAFKDRSSAHKILSVNFVGAPTGCESA